MTKSRRTVTGPTGESLSGVPVGIKESTERFSELTLEDGTILKTKVVAVDAIRLDGKDGDGNPMYVLRSQTVVTVVDSPFSEDPHEQRTVQ